MSKEHFIQSPDQLQRLAEEDQSVKHHIHISIFAPIAHKEVLEQCRYPDSRYSRNSTGEPCDLMEDEYLNIDPLGKAWRQNWKAVPTTISQVTFDLTLPVANDGVKQVRSAHPDGTPTPRFHPTEYGTQRLINTLVLEMHMRSRGRVKMDLSGEGDGQPEFWLIRNHIEALEAGGMWSRGKSLQDRIRPPRQA